MELKINGTSYPDKLTQASITYLNEFKWFSSITIPGNYNLIVYSNGEGSETNKIYLHEKS